MVRPRALASMGMLLGVCLCAGACESVLGSVEVTPAPRRQPGSGPVAPQPEPSSRPAFELPSAFEPVAPPVVPPAPPVADASANASPTAPLEEVDAGSVSEPVPAPRPVLADGVATLLERVGVDGGGPRLGACEPGIVIGVRPTANPSPEIFGQRLTFVEPICGAARVDVSGAIGVTRDDSLLRWDSSGEFQGEPSDEVPDARLVWVAQPEAFCPESAPALVGLAGEYDPVAPDSAATAAIRSLVLECAPLAVAEDGVGVIAQASGHQLLSRADSFATSGAEEYRSACEEGAVITRLQLHAGFWLDGFVLGCAPLRSPRPAGAACSVDRECAGICAPAGVCEP